MEGVKVQDWFVQGDEMARPHLYSNHEAGKTGVVARAGIANVNFFFNISFEG